METAQNESSIQENSKFNISQMMNAWTTQPHYPVLKIKQYFYNTSNMIVLFENIHVSYLNDWWIPLTFITIDDLLSNYTNYKIFDNAWLQTSPMQVPYHEITLNNNKTDWMLINLQTGKY